MRFAEFNQGNKSIHDYYSGFINLWIEYAIFVYATVLLESLIALQSVTPPNRLSENHSEFWGVTGVGSTKLCSIIFQWKHNL